MYVQLHHVCTCDVRWLELVVVTYTHLREVKHVLFASLSDICNMVTFSNSCIHTQYKQLSK